VVSADTRNAAFDLVSTTGVPSRVAGQFVRCTGAIDWSTKAVGGGTRPSVAGAAHIEHRTGELRDRTAQLAGSTAIS
jgi:hypothetical protein